MTFLTASTLGAPHDDLQTVLGWLSASGLSAIELRSSAGQIAHPAMTGRQIDELRSHLRDAGVAVSSIASYVRIASDTNDEMVVGALSEALMLAARLDAPFVRVFPGAKTMESSYDRRPQLVESDDEVADRAARRLSAVSTLAEDLGVYPALETHDSHPRGADIAPILERCAGPVGAVWDLMHPWRTGESLDETWRHLSPWLTPGRGGVQVKDAALPEDPTPLPVGEGHLPVEDFAELLLREGYSGGVSLEWERAWYPGIGDLGSALSSTTAWFDRHWRPNDLSAHS